MSQVDFYILKDNSNRNIPLICCQLCSKALQNDMSIFIYTHSLEQAEQLDNLLWTYKSNSFLAHKNIVNQIDKLDSSTNTSKENSFNYPLLSSANAPDRSLYNDILINLTDEVPPFHTQFKRIAEMVDKNLSAKEYARNLYRFYQQQHYELNKYEL